MKKQTKLVKMVSITFLLLFWGFPVLAENCANGAGYIIYGNDKDPDHNRPGTKYCLSKVSMNWWSAFAWCDAAGGKLISTSECNKSTTTEDVDCPNLKGIYPNAHCHTSTGLDYFGKNNGNYRVDFNTGAIYPNYRKSRDSDPRALCLMD